MGRGPSYPFVGLEESIALTRKMYDYTKRAPIDLESVITEAWKYSPSSSTGHKVVAALRAFGLVEDSAGNNGKLIKLTARAVRILLDNENSVERKEEIKKAALAPNWYGRCWKRWGAELPASMRASLLIDEKFVDTTVDGFLRDYKKTLAFAGILTEEETGENPESSKGEEEIEEPESNIELDARDSATQMLALPRREALLKPPATESAMRTALLNAGYPSMQTETFSLPEGVIGQLQWPSTMSLEAYEDFVYQLEGLKNRVKRAIRKDAPTPAAVPLEDAG